MEPRFLLLSDVAAELNVSDSQVYHMVRSGELPAIKIGGRGQWRVERARLEEYIAAQVRRDRRVGAEQPAGRPRPRVDRARPASPPALRPSPHRGPLPRRDLRLTRSLIRPRAVA